MDKWRDIHSTYLYLLLEMQGLTRAPTCSMCTSMMEVKCTDCYGANFFCKSCCFEVHRCSPYHRTFQWTGQHFTPVTLHELGFILYLGHYGTPCPLTYKVRLYSGSNNCPNVWPFWNNWLGINQVNYIIL